jgi:dTDP-4-dehydrorhamnose 3,5-epimerase
MNLLKTYLDGLSIINPNIYDDNRGSFFEAYNKEELQGKGILYNFVQDNQLLSFKNVLRGVHVQKENPQAKIVRVLRGRIWDVAVDMRKHSLTYGKWFGLELSSENKKQLFIPENFAHGFLTLSDEAEVLMKVTTHYHPGDEIGFIWNDPFINIEWPIHVGMDIILADKDKQWKTFKETF